MTSTCLVANGVVATLRRTGSSGGNPAGRTSRGTARRAKWRSRLPRRSPHALAFGRGRGDEPASAAQHQELLDLGDGLGRVQILWAGFGTVQDRVAAIEAERVFQRVEPIAGFLVAAVGDPAIGLQQDRRAEIAVAIPPIGRAGGAAAEAQDAFPQPA